MNHHGKSIRPFLGSEDFELSRSFYRDLGFEENVLFHNLSVFHSKGLSFYLQDAYVPDWINNTMVFMEVENVIQFWEELVSLKLTEKYRSARLTPVCEHPWGRVCYVHDPCGILWHFGEFFPE
jgi:hypothetical protein